MTTVHIEGDGIAARCSAYLLAAHGIRLALDSFSHPKPPVIVIGAGTQRLFQDLFSTPDLFHTCPGIMTRVVTWGGAQSQRLAHNAVVASEKELLDRLPSVQESHQGSVDWTIYAHRAPPDLSTTRTFGRRLAHAVRVRLRPGFEPSACWIEALENGWMFLVPYKSGQGWLLSAGMEPEPMLARSRSIEHQVDALDGPTAMFPAHPRIAWPICGPGWLACGSGALGFDPLCGDGSGYALREAILAGALVRSAQRGANVSELLSHYRARVLAGLMRHLTTAHDFYAQGGRSAWWLEQAASMREGICWCQENLARELPFRYQLRDLDLYRIE